MLAQRARSFARTLAPSRERLHSRPWAVSPQSRRVDVVRSGLVVVLAFAVATTLLLSGCGGGSKKPSDEGPVPGTDTVAAGENGAPGSAESTTTLAEPYPAITPESDNEKRAVRIANKALSSNAEGQRAANKQNGIDGYVFSNEEGYKPVFVGHSIVLLTGKLPDGQYGFAQVVVLGDKVTIESAWEYDAIPTVANGMINTQYFRVASPSDPLGYTTVLEPKSAAEKNAVAKAAEWMKTAVPEMGFSEARLRGYVFTYGEPGSRPNAILWTNPDATAIGVVSSSP